MEFNKNKIEFIPRYLAVLTFISEQKEGNINQIIIPNIKEFLI